MAKARVLATPNLANKRSTVSPSRLRKAKRSLMARSEFSSASGASARERTIKSKLKPVMGCGPLPSCWSTIAPACNCASGIS
eukprot:9152621-Alexandrium_andersonii.AAC.1